MKKLILLVSLFILLFGCQKSQPDSATNDRTKPLSIAIVTNNSSDWWTIAQKGGEKAVSEFPNVTLDFRMLPEASAASQKALVDDLLVKGFDGIAVSPLDVANQKQMLNEAAAKTLLFTLGADAPETKRVAYAGTDDVASGRMAGDVVKQALPNGGKIMVFVGRTDAQNAIDRLNGLKAGIMGGNIEIIDVRTDESDMTKAKSNAADALVKYPEIDGMVGLWSYNAPAVLNAVKDAGKTGKIKIIAFDEDDQTLQGIKDGDIYATVVQQPFGFTYEAVKRMILALRGDKSQIPPDGKIIYPTEVIRRDNVDKFWTDLKKLRGR